MYKITSKELRSKWLKFFADRGHTVIPSASLIPENDPTVLFTTAGMHPLVPYLLGSPHPAGKRLTDVQKCVRTGDIDDVGDDRHCTFFEMLGNWSLGDYFKTEMIPWSFEFLTSPDYLGIPVDRLAVTVFKGDNDCPRDEEAAQLWHQCGIPTDRIFFEEKKHNWWGPAGVTGPCGPDTEMFFDTGKPACGPACGPSCDCGKYLEIWNDVFMQYNKTAEGNFEPLSQKNVDTGMGLERTVCVLNGLNNVYETDVFQPIIRAIEKASGATYQGNEQAFRVIADHIRTATFILGDPRGVTPSNVDQGYVLRRLIRRAVRYGRSINLPQGSLAKISAVVIGEYSQVYTELQTNATRIIDELNREENKFLRTLTGGLKEFDKVAERMTDGKIDGVSAFHLYDTYGFPIEMTEELAKERGFTVDIAGFETAFAEHQAKSHAGAEQKFKGGLADDSEAVARLHTATHLLQAALRKVLGDEVAQRGSNITAERLRFDFTFGRKVTPEELKEVEQLVNESIAAKAPIVCEMMTVPEAKEQGAIGLFESKYGETVKVYTMGAFSKEICGGPHASNTGDLGHFKILKEESSSSGVRRIKAILN